MTPKNADITRLLRDVNADREGAMDELMRVVYDDLQRVAARRMSERFGPGLPGVTLEPAALVNESFLEIIKQRKKYDNRGQFFAIATKVMLRVLVDYQRRRGAAKRGGDRLRVALDLERHGPATPGSDASIEEPIEVDALVEALERLEALDARKADVVKMKVIWGLEMNQIAESLGVSVATVERDWAFSKAWLCREAQAGGLDAATPGCS
jgi:RNA polymerase sigma factor (TIGR02999 family)